MESSALELSLILVCLGAAGYTGYRLCMKLEEASNRKLREYFGLSGESRGITVEPGKNARSIYDHTEMEKRILGTHQ